MQFWKRRSPRIDTLSPRTLLATRILLTGKSFKSTIYTKDETQATLTETFYARSVGVSFETRYARGGLS